MKPEPVENYPMVKALLQACGWTVGSTFQTEDAPMSRDDEVLLALRRGPADGLHIRELVQRMHPPFVLAHGPLWAPFALDAEGKPVVSMAVVNRVRRVLSRLTRAGYVECIDRACNCRWKIRHRQPAAAGVR